VTSSTGAAVPGCLCRRSVVGEVAEPPLCVRWCGDSPCELRGRDRMAKDCFGLTIRDEICVRGAGRNRCCPQSEALLAELPRERMVVSRANSSLKLLNSGFPSQIQLGQIVQSKIPRRLRRPGRGLTPDRARGLRFYSSYIWQVWQPSRRRANSGKAFNSHVTAAQTHLNRLGT
jgi:hypothetical protein